MQRAIRCCARSREHTYLIDEEGIDMASSGGALHLADYPNDPKVPGEV